MQTVKRIVSIVFIPILMGALCVTCAGPGASTRTTPNPTQSTGATGFAKAGSTVSRTPGSTSRYENPTIGFALDFDPRWQVWSRIADMRSDFRDSLREMEAHGQEVLLAAHLNNIVGCRITTENLGVPAEDYATVIMDINKAEVDILRQETFTIAGRTMVEWEAAHPSTGLVFVEYVVLVGSYDIRMTFWTHPSLLERYKPEFRKVVASLRSI